MYVACAQPGGLLTDPQSNCSAWRRLYEQRWNADKAFMEHSIGASSLISYLDKCKVSYCSGYGVDAPECSCLSFPTRNHEQCALNASACIGTGGTCPGKHFTRYNEAFVFAGETYTGVFIDIQLPHCVPYGCWVDACIRPSSMLTSDIVSAQESSQCTEGICIVVQGTDTVVVPAPASSFTPSSTIIAPCGGGDAPPFPLAVPFIYVTPIDTLAHVQVVVSNSGTRLLVLTLGKSSHGSWASAPQTIYIAPQSASRVSITLTPTILYDLWRVASAQGKIAMVPTVYTPDGENAPPNQIAAPTFYYTYTDGTGGPLQPFQFSVLLNLLQPSEAVQKTVSTPSTPRWIVLTTLACALVFLFTLAAFQLARR